MMKTKFKQEKNILRVKRVGAFKAVLSCLSCMQHFTMNNKNILIICINLKSFRSRHLKKGLTIKLLLDFFFIFYLSNGNANHRLFYFIFFSKIL